MTVLLRVLTPFSRSAGRDTTAQALSWCVYELSSNPEVVQELRDTLDEETHLPEDVHSLNDQALSFDELQRWKYGHAVISETLRKYPSVPKQAKQAMEDVEMDNGLVIPAGSWIVWSSVRDGLNKFLYKSDVLFSGLWVVWRNYGDRPSINLIPSAS